MGSVALMGSASLEWLRITALRGDDAPVSDRVVQSDVMRDRADRPPDFDSGSLPLRGLEILDEAEERDRCISTNLRANRSISRERTEPHDTVD
jgi:hypothetical protein